MEWREAGIEVKPWRATTKELQLHYAKAFLSKHRSITPDSARAYLLAVPIEHHSKRKHIHSALSSLSKYLCRIGQLTNEDYLKIRALYPKASPNYKPKQLIIYDEDIEPILQSALKLPQRYNRNLNYTLALFLSETGLRVTEACNLKWEHLTFSESPTQASVYVDRGKRLVPFSKRAQEAMKAWRDIVVDLDNLVFVGFNGKTGYIKLDRSCVARRFRYISKRVGVPFTPHSFRHYRITQWANNSRIPITVVQKWAGHSSLEITQRYIHIRDEEALRAAFE